MKIIFKWGKGIDQLEISVKTYYKKNRFNNEVAGKKRERTRK
jgi:hypothetical protein